ncbi:MAG: PAS domain S-box protein [Bacteroidota bacterium]
MGALQRDQEHTIGFASTASLLNAFPDPCYMLSRGGLIVAVNNVAAEVLNQPIDTLLGHSLASLLKPQSRGEYSVALTLCFIEGGRHSCEIVFDSPGRSNDFVMSLSPFSLSGDSGEKFCLSVARDVTEEAQKDIDLLRFSNVAHYTLNPLEITDISGRIIYVNPAFELTSGYSKEELIGKNPNVFGSGKHPKSFWQDMWQVITSGKVWTGEVENRRRNGEPFLTQLLISPIVAKTGKVAGYFGIHRDITEQRRLEHQLFQAQKMESIGTLAAGIAHEVGNPLTSISSLVQVVQRTTQDDFTKEKLDLVKHQVTRISKIIRDLVDFSRPSTYEVQLTDINKCLRQAIDIVKVGKKSRSVRFAMDLDPSVPSLHLVPDQVEQVLINILINAVDAVSDRNDGRIDASSRVDGENLRITIQDNGKGMSEVEVEKIFEPFFTTKEIGEGTGLGLWVSYGIVKSFHGQIRVESRIGHGSAFSILLPIHSDY